MATRKHGGHSYRKMWDLIIFGPDFLVCQVERCIQPSRAIDRTRRGNGSEAPSLDMIIPYGRGGDPADPHNYRPAHKGCNSSRGKGEAPARSWIVDDSP